MKNQARIEELIAKATDPVQQATLLVLGTLDHNIDSFEKALDSNTQATQEIATDLRAHRVEFSGHVLDEQKILSGVKWAWWAASAMGAAIVVLGGIIVTIYAGTIERDHTEIRAHSNRIAVVEASIAELLRRQQADDERHRAVDGRRFGVSPP